MYQVNSATECYVTVSQCHSICLMKDDGNTAARPGVWPINARDVTFPRSRKSLFCLYALRHPALSFVKACGKKETAESFVTVVFQETRM